ncbi:MAG: helix-turn-helix transcriptional regulator [Verrucomicrobiota bacterium]
MITRELIAASSEPIILSILCGGENYGYAIIQKVRICSEEQMQWTDGMLYPVLHRLEQKGLISARWKKGEGGPRRKYYRITARGKKVLEEQKAQWSIVHQTLNQLWRMEHV